MFKKILDSLNKKQTRNLANRVLGSYIRLIPSSFNEAGEFDRQKVISEIAILTRDFSPLVRPIELHHEIINKLMTHQWILTDADVNDQIMLHVLYVNTVGGNPESGFYLADYFRHEVGIEALPNYWQFKVCRDTFVPSDNW